jgi:hypothetical protein
MGNRSKFVAAAAVSAAAALANRRQRLGRAAASIGDVIMPSRTAPTVLDQPHVDESHAPGHRHLATERHGRSRRPRFRRKQRHDRGYPHPD